MSVTDERVANVLPTSEYSWLRAYVEYAKLVTPSPDIYHVGVGLGCLASVCRTDYVIPYVFDAKTSPNLWPLIIGATACGKTLALDTGIEILRSSVPTIVGGDPRSEEGFIKSLERKNRQTLVYPAFESFLAGTAGSHENNYRAKIRDVMVSAFDSGFYEAEKANANIVIPNIRLSVIAACTPAHLRTLTTALDWDGGFINRFMTFYGAPDSKKAEEFVPRGIDELEEIRQWLIDQLAIKADPTQAAHIKPGKCLGFTPEARDYWKTWRRTINSDIVSQVDIRTAGCIRRVHVMAAKTAIILANDYGQAVMNEGGDWYLDMDVVKPACDLSMLHAESLIELTSAVATNAEMLTCNLILEELPVDGTWIHRGAILKKVGLLSKSIGWYLDTLEERCEIETKAHDGAIWIRRISGGCPPAYEESVAEEISGMD